MNEEKSSRLRRAFCSCEEKGRNLGYEDLGGVFQRGERKDSGSCEEDGGCDRGGPVLAAGENDHSASS